MTGVRDYGRQVWGVLSDPDGFVLERIDEAPQIGAYKSRYK